MDAFVHAFEAATNARTHTGIVPYADFAMRTIADALPRAVAHPTDLEVGADLLMASLCAGVAIENCGTAIAHALSHALAGCAPINHGLATVLAFEVTLPWLTRQNSASVLRVARSLGLQHVERLPPHVSTLMDECGIARKLPPAFKDISVSRLLEEADKPGNLPMRHTTAPQPNNADMHHFAEALLSLA
jgi:alcohol dehydrogenase class IV